MGALFPLNEFVVVVVACGRHTNAQTHKFNHVQRNDHKLLVMKIANGILLLGFYHVDMG